MAIKPDTTFKRFNFCSLLGIASELELTQLSESRSSILTFIFVQSKWSPPPSPFSLSAIVVTSACLYSQYLSLGREANKEVQGSKNLFKDYTTLCNTEEEPLCKLLLETCML